ncbi:MAG: DUF2971 domain-containing protein [Pseudomonadota bacterium]
MAETIDEPDYGLGFLRALWWPIRDRDKFYPLHATKKYNFLNWISDAQKVYHYTNTEALIGIVSDHGFWMTHHAYLNDYSEYLHGKEMAIDVLNALLKKDRFSKFSEIIEGTVENLANSDDLAYYITSFTRERDSLEQWRAYGKTGGINIELDAQGHGGDVGMAPDLMFHKVIYEDKEKVESSIFWVRRFFIEYNIDRKVVGPIIGDDAEDWIQHLSSRLRYTFTSFKHSAFKEENEVRIIVPESFKDRFVKSHYRAKSGAIVEYLKTNEYSKLLPGNSEAIPKASPLSIKSIIVGPQPERKMVAQSVGAFMRENGYPNVEIEFSKAPYRSI